MIKYSRSILGIPKSISAYSINTGLDNSLLYLNCHWINAPLLNLVG